MFNKVLSLYELQRKIRDLTESQQSPCESTLKGSINWSKDDIYSQSVGNREHSGRIRGLGFGFSSKNCGSTSNSDARFRVVSDEERMREKDNYIHELEVKVHDQSEKLHDQAEKLDSTINELSTVKGVLDFLIKQSGFQVRTKFMPTCDVKTNLMYICAFMVYALTLMFPSMT